MIAGRSAFLHGVLATGGRCLVSVSSNCTLLGVRGGKFIDINDLRKNEICDGKRLQKTDCLLLRDSAAEREADLATVCYVRRPARIRSAGLD